VAVTRGGGGGRRTEEVVEGGGDPRDAAEEALGDGIWGR